MSNFLDNLIIRSRGDHAPQVRPRLAHPFETFGSPLTAFPSSTLEEPLLETDEPRAAKTRARRTSLMPTAEDASAPSPAARSPHRTTAAPTVEGRKISRPDITPGRAQGKPASSESESSEPSAQTPAAMPGSLQPDRAPQTVREESNVSTLEPQVRPQFQPQSQPGILYQPEVRQTSTHARDDSAPPAEEAPAATQNSITESQPSAFASTRTEPAFAPADPGIARENDSVVNASHAQVNRRPLLVAPDVKRLEPLKPSAATEAAPAPTIRVTIGRVEVRAVMPPAPPARERTRPAPKLSLDEYLRSQNGGKR